MNLMTFNAIHHAWSSRQPRLTVAQRTCGAALLAHLSKTVWSNCTDRCLKQLSAVLSAY